MSWNKGDRFDYFGRTMEVLAVRKKGREFSVARVLVDNLHPDRAIHVDFQTWHVSTMAHAKRLDAQGKPIYS
jgi:hypothetical protein